MSAVERFDLGHRSTSLDELRRQIAPKATDDELRYFAEVCRRYDLTPWGEQIVLIGRWSGSERRLLHRPQITVAGRRTLAERTGQLLAIEGPVWAGPRVDGELRWLEVWTDDDAPPYVARTLVHRAGRIMPANGTAKWSEFAQTDRDDALMPLWRQMPSHMLGKVSESLALRRAFADAIPTDLDPGPALVAATYEEGALVDVDADALGAGDDEPVSAETRADLAARAAYLTRADPQSARIVKDLWRARFGGRDLVPTVAGGLYTAADASWMAETLDHYTRAPAGPQEAPGGLYDEDDGYAGVVDTSYDPDDAA